jgi:hypothetical protein
METIIQQGIIDMICNFLIEEEPRYIVVALEGLINLLEFGKKYYTILGKNEIVKRLDVLGMFDILERLQLHPVELVYEKTIHILDSYFEIETLN